MNNQSNKKILFNKSSLISLKAELLKKQEEVSEKKQQPQHKIENFKPLPTKGSLKEPTEDKKTFKDSLKAIDVQELEAIKKSKAVLEKKAELYEHLADSAGNSELAANFLVDFNSKKRNEPPQELSPSPEPVKEDEQADNDDWTEFTDCLGRTRRCLKADLDLYMQKDLALVKIMTKDPNATGSRDEPEKPQKEKPFLVQKTNDYLQTLRVKWEEKERELLAKDKDIHYQDVLFDEARQHGVSYYAFSTDENERRKQMEQLQQQRAQTLAAQKSADQRRAARDDLMAARVAAARARQRLRAGLPPEDPEQSKKEFTEHLLQFLTQQKNEADAKANEEKRKEKEEKERERQKMRDAYVREWDVGKDGVEKPATAFREMTQEEYVEQQRAKRIDEFAPLTTANRNSDISFDESGRRLEPVNKSWSDVRPKPPTPPPPDINFEEQRGLYFSTAIKPKPKPRTPPHPDVKKHVEKSSVPKKQPLYSNFVKPNETCTHPDKSEKHESIGTMRYRNFVKHAEPTPIMNEVDDNDDIDADDMSLPRRSVLKRAGVPMPTPIINEVDDNDEIDIDDMSIPNRSVLQRAGVAPPPTYEYYGPVLKRQKPQIPFSSDVREAYAQGVKSLQKEHNDRKLSRNYDFVLD